MNTGMTKRRLLRATAVAVTWGMSAALWAVPAVAQGRAPQAVHPRVVVSVMGSTLRLQTAPNRAIVFPVGVGRLTDGGQEGPLGTLFTGPDPGDRDLYIPRRRLPAFHRGLPYLRLDRRRAGARPFGIHGPVSPTLIWGRVSRGCIRMRPTDIRRLYRVAARHPSMPVTFVRGLDRVGGKAVVPAATRPAVKGCPEAAIGVRRLRRLATGAQVHDRRCGGVDHWYSIPLEGGDVTSVKLNHGGGLRVELFGIKAISAIAAGPHGFAHRIPRAPRNRGDRFIRVTGAAKEAVPYTLSVNVK